MFHYSFQSRYYVVEYLGSIAFESDIPFRWRPQLILCSYRFVFNLLRLAEISSRSSYEIGNAMPMLWVLVESLLLLLRIHGLYSIPDRLVWFLCIWVLVSSILSSQLSCPFSYSSIKCYSLLSSMLVLRRCISPLIITLYSSVTPSPTTPLWAVYRLRCPKPLNKDNSKWSETIPKINPFG